MIAKPAKPYTLPMLQLHKRTPRIVSQSKTLRILMVTPRYFPMMGGVENHVYQVARRLAHAGVSITVLTTDPSKKMPAYEKIEGIHIQRVHAWPSNRDYYFAPGLYNVIRRGEWDLMHLQSYHTLVAPVAMLAAQQARIPYVVTFHGGGHSSALRNRMRSVQQTLLRPLLARAQKLVAVAHFEIGYYGARLHLTPERFAVIPNGCDLALKETVDAEATTGGAPRPIEILSVGRLERYKGHHRILAAMPAILAHYPEARLRILGEGPYQAELQQQAAALGVSEQVAIGGIPMAHRAQMAATLSGATLVTLLSDYETHPIAALEALALKRPVLVSNTSGLQELADQGLARAIALESTPQEVARAVIEQIRSPLVPTKLDLPTWDDCARELLMLYRACIGRF
ncbi:MAG: glycosyltransferase family 4 protein [Caldilineaceae bacterium]